MVINTKKRGRPPKANPAKGRLEIRLTEMQKKAYMEAAAKSDKQLAAWVKDTLDNASRNIDTFAQQPRLSEQPHKS